MIHLQKAGQCGTLAEYDLVRRLCLSDCLVAHETLGTDLLIARLHGIQFFVAELFDVHHLIASRVDGVYQFVQLEVDGASIPVLCVLNEENHEEGDDHCTCIDDQLPRIGIAKDRTGRRSHQDDGHCTEKCPFGSKPRGSSCRKFSKGVTPGFSNRRNPHKGLIKEKV